MIDIKIILLLLIFHYISLFTTNKKTNILTCGIFGQLTNNPSKLDISSVNLLGIYNIERGKSSCGLTYDGDIFLGLDKDKLYSDFIKRRNIQPKTVPIIFGHTRQASVGAVNSFNAHPFGFGISNDGNYEFVGCHNGTLKNHSELAKYYNIDLTESYINDYNVKLDRTKIDSEILLEILYKTKSYDVLSKYIGGAALAWTWLDEPNKMYLFSGSSKMSNYVLYQTEERPLCAFQKSKNSTYFSSIEESLYAIGGNLESVAQIQHNTVYCITDGDLENAELTVIDRSKSFQTEPIYNNYNNHNNYINYDNHSNINVTSKSSNVKKHNIHQEEPLCKINLKHNLVYFQNLRYKLNGSPIFGIYVYLKNHGYYYIGDDEKSANETIIKNIGLSFCKHNFVRQIVKDSYIPFKLHNKIQKHYFVEGVALKTKEDYAVFRYKYSQLRNGFRLNIQELSHVSKHPVTTITSVISDNQNIYNNGVLFTGTVCPLGSDRIYNILKGNLINYRIIDNFKLITNALNPKDKVTKEYNLNELLDSEGKEPLLLPLTIPSNEEKTLIKEQSDNEFLNSLNSVELDELELVKLIDEEISEVSSNFKSLSEILDIYYPKNKKSMDFKEVLAKILNLLNPYLNTKNV